MHSLSRGALGRLVLPAPAVDAHEGFVLAITAGVDQIGDGHVPVSIVLLCYVDVDVERGLLLSSEQ